MVLKNFINICLCQVLTKLNILRFCILVLILVYFIIYLSIYCTALSSLYVGYLVYLYLCSLFILYMSTIYDFNLIPSGDCVLGLEVVVGNV